MLKENKALESFRGFDRGSHFRLTGLNMGSMAITKMSILHNNKALRQMAIPLRSLIDDELSRQAIRKEVSNE